MPSTSLDSTRSLGRADLSPCSFTLSPVYPAAQALLGERGCSVRFPRFIKLREDKSIENATTAEQLAALYRKQGEKPAATKKVEEVAE